MNSPKKGQTDTIEFSWAEKDIVRVKIKEGVEMDLEHSIRNSEALREFTHDRTYFQLVDSRVAFTITPEARDYSGKEEVSKKVAARAVLVDSLAVRLVTNFYSRSNPAEKVKIFEDEKLALQWLRSLRDKEW